MKSIYLDYAAATPVGERVFAAMRPYYSDKFYNPSAAYSASRSVAKDLAEARAAVAHWVGVRPAEIIFTAGGTEANNLAISGVMEQFPGARLVVSAVEHESVLEPARQYNNQEALVDEKGFVGLALLRKLIDDKTVLVSIMYANNEVGTIQPVKEIAGLVTEIRQDRQKRGVKRPLLFHTDAAQAGNYLDLHAARLGVDLMTLNGGKIYGPKQSGALVVRGATRLSPLILGGGQERSLRSGTENIAGAIGFARALEIAQQNRQEETKRLRELQKNFFEKLAQRIPAAVINGPKDHRLPNNLHVTFPGQDNERLIFALDEAGIMAAAGSACSASKDEASHVLAAMGFSDEAARASLRLTMGRSTTQAELDTVIDELAKLVT